ncbi:Spy/CpxP family protein refolding chaperone [Inquilinus sp. OTU3971]|uniref:Spy/CpxP family protein refolding chaperone n=1 Tax=Inquilinus sp. OTU3971 TaxID=3043855 RepID=UPI00313A91BE
MSIEHIVRVLGAAVISVTTVLGSASVAVGSTAAPGVRAEIARDAYDQAACGYWVGDGAARDLARIEETVRPTEGQRGSFHAFRVAVQQAQETMRAACRAGPSDETEVVPREIEAMLLAFAIICPAFDALYAQLTDYQKTRLYEAME